MSTVFAGEALTLELNDGLAEVRLHRAPCNEIGTTMLGELERVTDWLASGATGATALVLSSERTEGFCAGADLRELQAGIAERRGRLSQPAKRLVNAARSRGWLGARGDAWLARAAAPVIRMEVRRFVRRIHRVFDALDSAPIPVVAAVHGVTFGGGFELALTADLIVADRTARFAFPELRLGLIPGFGGIPRLERDFGNAFVRDILFTGRTIGAERMHELGALAQLVGPGKARDAALRLARHVSRYDASTVRQAKQFTKPIPRERLDQEIETFCEMVTSPAVFRALSDFVTRTDTRPYVP
jgi:enoyl-CoA hydratase/carnithine racemase